MTDVGPVESEVPHDRNGTSDRQIVRKGQTRLDGFNDRMIALYAWGLTIRDVQAHLREMYDVDVPPDLISRVTDTVYRVRCPMDYATAGEAVDTAATLVTSSTLVPPQPGVQLDRANGDMAESLVAATSRGCDGDGGQSDRLP